MFQEVIITDLLGMTGAMVKEAPTFWEGKTPPRNLRAASDAVASSHSGDTAVARGGAHVDGGELRPGLVAGKRLQLCHRQSGNSLPSSG